MEPDEAKVDAILKVIQSGESRFGKIFSVARKNEPMSEMTFQNHLLELVEGGYVNRIEKGYKDIEYEIHQKAVQDLDHAEQIKGIVEILEFYKKTQNYNLLKKKKEVTKLCKNILIFSAIALSSWTLAKYGRPVDKTHSRKDERIVRTLELVIEQSFRLLGRVHHDLSYDTWFLIDKMLYGGKKSLFEKAELTESGIEKLMKISVIVHYV